jgi:hypothetical protein
MHRYISSSKIAGEQARREDATDSDRSLKLCQDYTPLLPQKNRTVARKYNTHNKVTDRVATDGGANKNNYIHNDTASGKRKTNR